MFRYLIGAILVLISSIFLVKCQEENVTQITQNKNKQIKFEDVGYYHNQALDMLFNDDNINASNLSYLQLREVITNKLIDKYPKKFNEKSIKKNEALINKNLIKNVLIEPHESSKNGTLKPQKESFNGDFQLLFTELKNKNKISQKFYERLTKLYSNRDKWFKNDDPVEYAKDIVSKETLSTSGKKIANNFINVLNSSFIYWKSKRKKNNKLKGSIGLYKETEPCDLAPYGADAAGAIYGSLAGPVSSAINGAIFSAWTEVSCNYHSK